MSESSPALRIGIAVSIAVHLVALIAGLGYAGFLLKPSGPEQSIAVDLITPQEVAELTKPPEQKPAPEQQSPSLPQNSGDQSPAAPPQAQQESKPPSTASQPDTPPPQQSAKPSPPTPPPSQQQPSPPAQAAIRPPEPDISLRYPMNLSMFGRAPGDFDAKADSDAQIDRSTAAGFRAQLKTCSTLPAEIAPDDKVVIVIRAQFQPDGRLATSPILIEASASPKGPFLMQAAIAALQACQPYASLPADKYQEWKMLDLTFTPRDFRRG